MRIATLGSVRRWGLLGALALAVPLACGSHEGASVNPGSEAATGDLGLALSVAPGETIISVQYTILGPNGFSKTDVIDVSSSTTITATIGALPVGSGFSIAFSATTTDGSTTCGGSASFSITARATTSVTVHLSCHEAVHTGALLVNGDLNACPAIDGIAANPDEVLVGGSLALSAQAHDTDGLPSPLSYRWLATSGTLSDANLQNPVFSCTKAGPATLSVTVSDGDSTASCPATGSVVVNCSSASGAGGSVGASGASGGGAGGASAGSAGLSGGGTGGAAVGGSGGVSAGGASGSAGSVNGGTGGGGAAGAAAAVAVYRVGDASASLASTGNPVFVDEYSADGALVRSIAMPTVAVGASHRLVASGTATSEGFITRSTDGTYLVLTGYDAALPVTSGVAGTAAPTTPRTLARVNAAGDVDTTTALTDVASGNNPRSAASTNGVDFWIAGASGGVRYTTLGASTSVQLSTTVVNLRQVAIFGGQLFVSDSSGSAVRLGSVGVGLPTTTGQVITNLPGLPSSTGSPYGFYLADLDAGTPGLDTLYLADDSAGISKYSLVSGSWVSNGTFGAAADAYRGLTGVSSGGSVTLYAVGLGGSGATGGGQLVRLSDGAGYAGAFAPSRVTLATALSNTAFRGVALAPSH